MIPLAIMTKKILSFLAAYLGLAIWCPPCVIHFESTNHGQPSCHMGRCLDLAKEHNEKNFSHGLTIAVVRFIPCVLTQKLVQSISINDLHKISQKSQAYFFVVIVSIITFSSEINSFFLLVFGFCLLCSPICRYPYS